MVGCNNIFVIAIGWFSCDNQKHSMMVGILCFPSISKPLIPLYACTSICPDTTTKCDISARWGLYLADFWCPQTTIKCDISAGWGPFPAEFSCRQPAKFSCRQPTIKRDMSAGWGPLPADLDEILTKIKCDISAGWGPLPADLVEIPTKIKCDTSDGWGPFPADSACRLLMQAGNIKLKNACRRNRVRSAGWAQSLDIWHKYLLINYLP